MTTLSEFVSEPFQLAIGQPHQMLISSASVAIVAAEASTLIPWPYNIALAIGAEWAYLRGLISGAGIRTPWAARLNVSAVMLVVLYGSLWGFRSFHLIPDEPPTLVAVLLTVIHIGAIGAVTICSAMLHRDVTDKVAAAVADQEKRNRVIEDARKQKWQEAQDAIEIEARRQRAQLQIEEAATRQKMQLATERAQLRAATRQAQPKTQPRIVYNGVEYPTIQAAADAHGITRQAMSKRLKKETTE